ncbi:MAG: RodZ domain-containing protein [Spirochaetia bacterium]
MDAIGKKLKSAREEMGKSIEEIARETNIAKRFIVALEEEDFDAFPGEPYIIGFLRTYSETLGLSVDEILSLYKSFKIQEQPLPMDELIQKPNRKPLWFTLIAVVLLAGIGAGIYFAVPAMRDKNGRETAQVEPEPVNEAEEAGAVYQLRDEIVERKFAEGDTLLVETGEETHRLVLVRVDDSLALNSPQGRIVLTSGEERLVDLDGDGKEDIKLFLREIEVTGTEREAVLRLDKFTEIARISARESLEEETVEEGIFAEVEEANQETVEAGEESAPEIGSTTVVARQDQPRTIIESDTKEPLTIDMIFRGYCLLRYLADGRTREERYFHKGETFRLEAETEVMLWISNAGSFKAKIGGRDVDMGRPGEVATKMVRWIQNDETGTWQLRIVPVY